MGISGFVTPDYYLLGRNLFRVFDEQRQTARCRVAAVYPTWTRKGFYWTRMNNENGSREEWRVKNSSCSWLWSQQILCVATRLLGLDKIKTDISWWRYKTRLRCSSGHKKRSITDDLQGHNFTTARSSEKFWTARRDRFPMWHVHCSSNVDWNRLWRWGENRRKISEFGPYDRKREFVHSVHMALDTFTWWFLVNAILNLRCYTMQRIIDYLGFSRGLSTGGVHWCGFIFGTFCLSSSQLSDKSYSPGYLNLYFFLQIS